MQLREKELDDEAFLKEAVEIHALCQRYGVPFFVNDNVDIAIRCHAEGVHVGQEDMAAAQVRARVGEGMMIGVSVHSVEEAREAVKHGADCLGVGAAFATHTKTAYLKIPEEKLSKMQRFLKGKGSLFGFFVFIPVIGDIMIVALGLLRANPLGTLLSMMVGKFSRYYLVVIGINYLKEWFPNLF